MYKPLRHLALRILKVPAEPHAPIGDPASLRVFNAGKNYWRLRLAGWAIAQIFALAGLIFWTVFLISIANGVREEQAARATAPQPAAQEQNSEARLKEILREIAKDGGKNSNNRKNNKSWADFKKDFVNLALLLPSGIFILLWLLKAAAILAYLIQLPLTYAVRRLDYEMRWYMVTDRSLRLRHGVWKISESTMSFANIQQVVVSQGPLQRLLGLADVKVKSAGGGDTQQPGHHQTDDMHSGLFHCVTNAEEIRNLILDRLRRFREAGLGDPDEKHIDAAPSHPSHEVSPESIAAARTLAAEARALRGALTA